MATLQQPPSSYSERSLLVWHSKYIINFRALHLGFRKVAGSPGSMKGSWLWNEWCIVKFSVLASILGDESQRRFFTAPNLWLGPNTKWKYKVLCSSKQEKSDVKGNKLWNIFLSPAVGFSPLSPLSPFPLPLSSCMSFICCLVLDPLQHGRLMVGAADPHRCPMTGYTDGSSFQVSHATS